MSMNKNYRWCALYPALLSVVLSLLHMGIIQFIERNNDDMLGFKTGFMIGSVIGKAIIVAISFLPVYLNKLRVVRGKPVLRLLSWWFLPVLTLLAILGAPGAPAGTIIKYRALMTCLFVATYITGSLVGWRMFTRNLKRERESEQLEFDFLKS